MKKIIIKNTIKFENLEIADQDFFVEDGIDWYESIEECKKLGNGWRLPTIEELEKIYLQKDKIKLLKKNTNLYWSSTEAENGHSAWWLTFEDGDKDISNKYFRKIFRPVRTIDLS